MIVTMPEPSKSLTQPSLTRPEIKLMVRWTPIIGSKYSHDLASGKDAEGKKFLLTLPFAVVGVGMVKSNLPIAYLILATGFVVLGILEYFAAKRLRDIGKEIVDDLNRLGLNPSSVPKLKRVSAFERWMVVEGLTSSSIREAGMLHDTPDGASN
jgi:hypothetical protein